MRRAWWFLGLAMLTGCATVAPGPAPPPPPPPPAPSPSSLLLARADRLLVQGDYDEARRAYGDFASQYPDDGATPRALATRDALDVLAASGEELARINADAAQLRQQIEGSERELARLRRDLSARDSEVARVRQELAERQAELTRLSTEAEKLRADLEKLKNVDLRLERRR
jgi:TolA-binding protein